MIAVSFQISCFTKQPNITSIIVVTIFQTKFQLFIVRYVFLAIWLAALAYIL